MSNSSNQALLNIARTAPLAISGFQFLNDVVVPHQVSPNFIKKYVISADSHKAETWKDIIRTTVLAVFHAKDVQPHSGLSEKTLKLMVELSDAAKHHFSDIAAAWDTVHDAFVESHAEGRKAIPILADAYRKLGELANPIRKEVQFAFRDEDWTSFLRNVPHTSAEKRFPKFYDRSGDAANEGSSQGRETVSRVYAALFMPATMPLGMALNLMPQAFIDIDVNPMSSEPGRAWLRSNKAKSVLPGVKERNRVMYTLDAQASMAEFEATVLVQDREAISKELDAIAAVQAAEHEAQVTALLVNKGTAEKLVELLTPEQLKEFQALLAIAGKPAKPSTKKKAATASRRK